MDRKPRIAISPNALRALKVWSALEDKDPGALASELILAHMPARVRSVIMDIDHMPANVREDSGENTPVSSEGCRAPPDIGKRRRLSDNPDAIAKIKSLWAAGERNQAEISRQIGYHRSTVFDTIARMLKAGELQE